MGKRGNTNRRNTNRKLKLLRGGAATSEEISVNKECIKILFNIIKDLMNISIIEDTLSGKIYSFRNKNLSILQIVDSM